MSALKMKYFVLKPAGDDDYAIASRRAMQAYGQWLQNKGIENDDKEMRQLGQEVYDWAMEEHGASQVRRIAPASQSEEQAQ